jgi:hypothetical protein
MKTTVMTTLMATMAIVLLISLPAAFAQNGAGTSSRSSQSQSMRDAPIGHRQPRADQVPSEKNLSDPNNQINKEDAALDRRIKSICRGC